MPRARPVPIDDFLLDLEEAGLELPAGLSAPEAYRLAAAAAFFARRKKRVVFERSDLLRVTDRRAEVAVPIASVAAAADLPAALAAVAPAARERAHRTVLWVDASGSPDPEHLFEHALWGPVTLYTWPSKPRRPVDERILAAERSGWTPVLKQFNLVPGRGIVVEDGRYGLLVESPDAAALAGLVVHVGTGEQVWCPNPFVEARRADSDFQFWLNWGEGGPASEWKEVLRHGESG